MARRLTDEEVLAALDEYESDPEDNDFHDLAPIDDNGVIEDGNDTEGDEEMEVDDNEEMDVDDNEEEENEELIVNPRVHKRRILTKNRIVNSIDKALDPNSYDPIEIPAILIEHTVEIDKKKNKIVWTNKRPALQGRQSNLHIIPNRPGLPCASANASTAIDAWNIFISENITAKIVNYTNDNIQKFLADTNQRMNKLKRYPFIQNTSETEIRAYFGLMYARGLLSQNNYDVRILFQDKIGHPIFGATMSRDRFTFLRRMIAFDDIDTREERWISDRFAAFREIFEDFNINCATNLIPEDYLSLDETLYPMRTQISIKQYNPKKPSKYGLLFRSINSARYPYTHFMMAYAGKPTGLPNEYYVQGTDEAVKYLVTGMKKHVNLHGRNISMDRLYTSITIAKWLKDFGISMIGTAKSNRKGLPKEVTGTANRDEFSYQQFWDKADRNLVLSSYVVNTKSSGAKNVLILSTVQPYLGCTKDDGKKKPQIYKLYDFTKGGTDVVDQRMGFYTCKPKSRKWTTSALSYILDTARVNAATVFALKNGKDPKKMSSIDFGWDLVMALVSPHIRVRPTGPLDMKTKSKIQVILGASEEPGPRIDPDPEEIEPHPRHAERRGRCRECLNAIAGVGYKEKFKKINRVQTQCQKCGVIICEQHSLLVCVKCQQ